MNSAANSRYLQQAIEQEAHLPHFGAVIETFQWCHVYGESAVVSDLGELLDEFAVVDLALANADM